MSFSLLATEGSECPECGEKALVTEYVGGFPKSVCSDCGTVLDESDLDYIYANEEDKTGDFADEVYEESIDGQDTEQNPISSSSKPPKYSSVTANSEKEKQLNYNGSQENTAYLQQAPRTCESCHGRNLTQELINGNEQLICRDCGYFVEEDNFVSTREVAVIDGQGVTTYGWVRAPKPKFTGEGRQPPEGKTLGIKATNVVSRALNLDAELTEQAVKLYEKIYETEGVKRASISFKEAIGATCAYFIARENGVQVTFKFLQNQSGIKNIKLLTKALRTVESENSQSTSYLRLESLVSPILANACFSPEFQVKVSHLISICEKGWVTQGRKQSNIIVPAAYIVWQAGDVPRRFKKSLSEFCTDFKLHYFTRNASETLQIIRNLLITLAKQLPWVKPPIDKRKMLFHIDDIIKYQRTVFSKVEGERNLSKSTVGASIPNENCVQHQSLPPLHPPSMNRKMAEIDPKDLEICLPQGMTHADLDKPELAESEFEEELSVYLSTEEEVQAKKICLGFSHCRK